MDRALAAREKVLHITDDRGEDAVRGVQGIVGWGGCGGGQDKETIVGSGAHRHGVEELPERARVAASVGHAPLAVGPFDGAGGEIEVGFAEETKDFGAGDVVAPLEGGVDVPKCGESGGFHLEKNGYEEWVCLGISSHFIICFRLFFAFSQFRIGFDHFIG